MKTLLSQPKEGVGWLEFLYNNWSTHLDLLEVDFEN